MLSGTGTSRRFSRGAILLAVVMLPLSGAAQQSEGENDRRWLVGGIVGIPGHGNEPVGRLTSIGVGVTRFRPYRPGPDLALVFAPAALGDGFVAMGMRIGVAVPVPVVPGFTVVPSGGATLAAAAGYLGGLGASGWNWGLAGVVTAHDGTGVRFGLSWHHFAGYAEPAWLLELGFIRAPRFR